MRRIVKACGGGTCVRRFGARVAATALFTHFLAGVAWAQEKWVPPNQDKGILQWVITLAIVALVCVPAFLNPKRSHLN